MTYVYIVFAVVLVCYAYMLIRNEWVCQVRKKWIYAEPRKEMTKDPWYVFTYEEMLYRYWWIWDASEFERRSVNGAEGQP